MQNTCHINNDDLSKYIKDVFGNDYDILKISNLNGGAQKVVYKIQCVNGFTCMLYVWDNSMNYFREEKLKKELLDLSYGADLFQFNNLYFMRSGIKTPETYLVNREKYEYPFDFAIVEYISGGNLAGYLKEDNKIKLQILIELDEILKKMHSIEKSTYGKLNYPLSTTITCEKMIFERSLEHLTHASTHLEQIAKNSDKLLNVLSDSYHNIKPRDRYGLIHSELGPDHVLVNDKLEPFLIDIEGALFFDIEFEHSYLQFRFGEHYKYLKNDNLDYDRLMFYELHHHLSITSGGLKLLHRGFPNEGFLRGIIHSNSDAALKFL